MSSKFLKFKRILSSDQIEFLMEAHNGLSAKIVEEASFKGIWASSFTMSAAMGVRDCNEASWTQILEVLEFMSDVTRIPILVDADSGYGNFNNVRRLVSKLERHGIAAMCIEDKIFPKTNSLIDSNRHILSDIDEFAGKIKAAKDTQQNPDFCVVARTEAFIAGFGVTEALRRAEAYQRAGADAILVHDKNASADNIFAFMKAWQKTCPIVIVPTTYYRTPTSEFVKAGIKVIIWANFLLRAGITAMQRTAAQIFRGQSVRSVVPNIASVQDIFNLQNTHELIEAEQQYLTGHNKLSRSITRN